MKPETLQSKVAVDAEALLDEVHAGCPARHLGLPGYGFSETRDS
jgi:hypothetical protein